MQIKTRKILDRAFSGISYTSVFLLIAALVLVLSPIIINGTKSMVFKGTVDFRHLMVHEFGHGKASDVEKQFQQAHELRNVVFQKLNHFGETLDEAEYEYRVKYRDPFKELKSYVYELMGPDPDKETPVLLRKRYGQTRWDRVEVKAHELLNVEEYDYSDPTKLAQKIYRPRIDDFKGTSLESLFPFIEDNLEKMFQPEWTFYWQFLFDESKDAHFFGGIWPELLGTLYLTLGAMFFAIPMGVIAAIYLVEYAPQGRLTSFLRTFINTLAGVPSIVFGLFGLAFFINTVNVSHSKSVLAGSLTLSLLVLPIIIRASEEALLSVPQTYKEAALSVGASRWHTVLSVILPAAIPGILTGIVISMGRAAGETAPIIFTAAVSVGQPLGLTQLITDPTPALPWNIYNLATEHEAVDEIRHIQYGMVLVLMALVLLLNLAAVILRSRVTKRLRT